MDWYSRYVLSWALSTTLERWLCIEALRGALAAARPEIFHTDQGSQFTSEDFKGILQEAGVAVSMDGRGRAFDNIFIERLRRSVKYKEIYLKDNGRVYEARRGLRDYFVFYNNGSTPDVITGSIRLSDKEPNTIIKCKRLIMKNEITFIRCYSAVLLVLLSAVAAAASAGSENKSLKQICNEADRLAQTPEGLESAVAKYRLVIEIHRANEKVFLAALHGILEYYDEPGRIEDGARFLLALGQDLQNPENMKALQGEFGGFALKYRDVMDRIAEEMGLTAQQQREKKSKEEAERIVPSRALIDAILQRKDQSLREKSLAKLQEMLAPGSSNRDKGTALATLRSALMAKFDRQPFRPLVVPLLKSEDAEIRMRALQCLPALEATLEDLELIIPLAEDDSSQVRQEVGGALIHIGNGQEKERVIPALMKLLKDEEYKVIERTLRSMWGQYSSPEYDALLIELSRNPRHRGHVIYHCLSTMQTKSPEVCRRLIEELDEPDWNDSGRAAWGLTYGVTDQARSLVEEGLLKALPEETNSYTRKQEFQALRRVATEKSRPYLRSVIDSDMETEEHKDLARQILTDLDRKQ